MQRSIFVLVLILGLTPMPRAWAKLFVTCTTPDIASIATAVVGDRGEIVSLARPSEDPHYVDAKPSFIAKLNKADLLIEGGAELESGWLGPLVESARNPKIAAGSPGRVSCSEGLTLMDVPVVLDRSQGDVHAKGNPHFLVDPMNAIHAATVIAKAAGQVDPPNATNYQERLTQFKTRIEAKMREWTQTLAPFKGQHLVAYHKTWPYFTARFGLKSELFLEPKPGIPPTPAHLASVVERMKSVHAHVIAVEPFQSRKTAERVAQQCGASVVDVAQYPGGLKGVDADYVNFMDALVKAVAAALAKP